MMFIYMYKAVITVDVINGGRFHDISMSVSKVKSIYTSINPKLQYRIELFAYNVNTYDLIRTMSCLYAL